MYKHSHNISRNIIVYFDSTHFRVALLYFMNWMPSLKAAFIYFLALYTRLVVQWFVSCIQYITSIAFTSHRLYIEIIWFLQLYYILCAVSVSYTTCLLFCTYIKLYITWCMIQCWMFLSYIIYKVHTPWFHILGYVVSL